MTFPEYFPIFYKMTQQEQEQMLMHVVLTSVPQGTLLHNGDADCTGLMLIRSGQLRAHLTSEEGREITLYRLFERDICLFSASCIMSSIQFEITITAEKDTQFWLIPADFYKSLMQTSLVVVNYTTEIMATRFTNIMWLIEQIMWKSFDKRLAAFLLEECAIENSTVLKTTHEIIASHLGSAREVVTRMLKYFQNEGMVKLTRGTIELVDMKKLETLESV